LPPLIKRDQSILSNGSLCNIARRLIGQRSSSRHADAHSPINFPGRIGKQRLVNNPRCPGDPRPSSDAQSHKVTSVADITSTVKQKGSGESVPAESEEEVRHQHPQESESGPQKPGYGDSSTELEQQPASLDNTLQGLMGSTRQTTPATGLKSRGRRPTSGSWRQAAPPALTGLLSLLVYCR
jgi:hypothetical protein